MTGIWNLAPKSDLRAEISGSIVRYDALAPRPAVLLLWYFVGACAATLKLNFFLYSWRKHPHRIEQIEQAADVIYWDKFLQQVDKNFSLLLRSCLRCLMEPKRKIRDKNKRYCRQMYWSDMYQEVRFNRRTEAGGGGGGELMWATRSAPPVILCLLRACTWTFRVYFFLIYLFFRINKRLKNMAILFTRNLFMLSTVSWNPFPLWA